MIFFGILIGLAGAVSQSFAYLVSRHFVAVSGGRSARKLLVVGHVWMGLISLILLPFVWLPPRVDLLHALIANFAVAFFYFIGQAGFFWTVKQLPASRVAPLLGLKIVFLGVFSVLFFAKDLTVLQWTAIGLAAMAAVFLSRAGEILTWRVVLGLCYTCTCFAMSDLSIPPAMEAFAEHPGAREAALSVCLAYLFCGLIVLPWIWQMRLTDRVLWWRGLPFAITWYLGMLCLFACIGLVQVILAAILQSSRGLISIGLGRLVARRDLTHLETHQEPGVVFRQVAAALLMFIAVVIYVWSG